MFRFTKPFMALKPPGIWETKLSILGKPTQHSQANTKNDGVASTLALHLTNVRQNSSGCGRLREFQQSRWATGDSAFYWPCMCDNDYFLTSAFDLGAFGISSWGPGRVQIVGFYAIKLVVCCFSDLMSPYSRKNVVPATKTSPQAPQFTGTLNPKLLISWLTAYGC